MHQEVRGRCALEAVSQLVDLRGSVCTSFVMTLLRLFPPFVPGVWISTIHPGVETQFSLQCATFGLFPLLLHAPGSDLVLEGADSAPRELADCQQASYVGCSTALPLANTTSMEREVLHGLLMDLLSLGYGISTIKGHLDCIQARHRAHDLLPPTCGALVLDLLSFALSLAPTTGRPSTDFLFAYLL